MLQSLTLTNFKSFAGDPQTVPFAPVTVFVGANGSGKSNVFDALRFLHAIGLELQIGEVLDGKTEGGTVLHSGIRGGAAEVCWANENSFCLETSAVVNNEYRRSLINSLDRDAHRQNKRSPRTARRSRFTFLPMERSVSHRINCEVTARPSVVEETLSSNTEGQLFVVSEKELKFLMDGPKGGLSPEILEGFAVDRSFLGQFRRSDGVHKYVELWSTALRLFYSRIRFQSATPAKMKRYVPGHLTDIGSEGENLSAALYQICKESRIHQQITEWISAFCAPAIAGIEFEKTHLGDVLLNVVEVGGRRISARSLSDGTLRFLAILTALYSSPRHTVFLLEEIENGMHPTRVHHLMELFEQFAESHGHQIIATTHSPQVLLGLSESALQNAVLFARDEEHPGTIVRRLGDLEHFDEVTKKTRIDELFSTGWLEFAV